MGQTNLGALGLPDLNIPGLQGLNLKGLAPQNTGLGLMGLQNPMGFAKAMPPTQPGMLIPGSA